MVFRRCIALRCNHWDRADRGHRGPMRLLPFSFTFALILRAAGCPAPTTPTRRTRACLGRTPSPTTCRARPIPWKLEVSRPGGRRVRWDEATHECVDDDGDGTGRGTATVCLGETTRPRIRSDTCTDDVTSDRCGCLSGARACGQFHRDPCVDWGEDLPWAGSVCNLRTVRALLCVDCETRTTTPAAVPRRGVREPGMRASPAGASRPAQGARGGGA
jgi:hypothetical protein